MIRLNFKKFFFLFSLSLSNSQTHSLILTLSLFLFSFYLSFFLSLFLFSFFFLSFFLFFFLWKVDFILNNDDNLRVPVLLNEETFEPNCFLFEKEMVRHFFSFLRLVRHFHSQNFTVRDVTTNLGDLPVFTTTREKNCHRITKKKKINNFFSNGALSVKKLRAKNKCNKCEKGFGTPQGKGISPKGPKVLRQVLFFR